MVPELFGSVGRPKSDNLPTDVALVQNFMGAWLGSVRSPMIGIAAVWLPMVYDDTLGDVIVFFQKRRKLPVADGRISRGGRTWREMLAVFRTMIGIDIPGWSPSRVLDLGILSMQQTLDKTRPDWDEALAITPASVMPFLFRPRPKNAMLAANNVTGRVSEFLFRIEKNGSIFWVGAAVPDGTVDFSRCYIFFHPDTISATDDALYPSFSGRWINSVKNYVFYLGTQMAAVKKMVLLVPFMTYASRSNSSTTNLFADRGSTTLDAIMSGIESTMGVRRPRGLVSSVGVASYSSGVNHLWRFAEMVGGMGIINEQIDFDSAYMKTAHKTMPVLPNAANWNVTQSPPKMPGTIGWLHLPHEAFQKVVSGNLDTHGKIGNMMFNTMMTISRIV